MTQSIRALTRNDLKQYEAHFKRLRLESGRGETHFLPFAPNDAEGPKPLDIDALDRPLSERGWRRWFIALSEDGSSIVGHVDLKGDSLKTGLHRCELGIGIERPYRGEGLGTKLMEAAIDFAGEAKSLSWIDLKVFAHNTAARSLYRRMGFVEVGTLPDRFRIDGQSVSDVWMTLDIAQSP